MGPRPRSEITSPSSREGNDTKGGTVINVLLADGCPATLKGLGEYLARAMRAKIVAQVTSLEATLHLAAQLRPEVVIIDPNFGSKASVCSRDSGVFVTHLLEELRSHLTRSSQVIVYSMLNTTAHLLALRLAEIDGYIHKSTPLEQLALNLDSVSAGRSSYWHLGLTPEEAQRRLLSAAKVERLSRAEKRVLTLMLQSDSDLQMAQSLHLSPHTVKKHAQNSLRKLGYRSRKDMLQD